MLRNPEMDVVNNQEGRQFEIHDGDQLARLTYAERAGVLDLIHTEVPRALEGQGYGNQLVAAALEYAAERSLLVRPSCPFAKAFIKRHPQYAKLTTRLDD